jgi:hypothetical protein
MDKGDLGRRRWNFRLGDHDLMAVRTEAEKYLMMGALNLVECVAFVEAVKPRR